MFTVLLFMLWCQKAGLVHLFFIKSHDNQFTRPNVLFCVCVFLENQNSPFECSFAILGLGWCKKKQKNKKQGWFWTLGSPETRNLPTACSCTRTCVDSCGHLNDCSSYCGCVLVLRHDRTHRVDALKLCTQVWMRICWSVPTCRLPEPPLGGKKRP